MNHYLSLLERVTAGSMMLRCLVAGSGIAALLLAVPAPLRIPQLAAGAALFAAVTAIALGRAWVSALEYVAVVVWIGTTTLGRYELSPAAALALAAALYLHHSAAAFAAVVPSGAVLAPEVVRAWLVRTAGVLGVSAVLGLLVLALPGLLGRTDAVLVPVLGLAALVAAGFGLTRLARDR